MNVPAQFAGLFCWAGSLEKASRGWQEEVKQSHRNIPQSTNHLVICVANHAGATL
jgi:hypothetical protein